MNKRRIAILISDLEGGGAQRQALFLAGEWKQRGHDVLILTYEPPNKRAFYSVPAGVQVVGLDELNKNYSLPHRLMRNMRRIRLLRGALEAWRADVVFAFMAEMSVTGFMAGKSLGLPVIACERSNPALYPESKMWRMMRDLAYPRCARIICQTQSAADYFADTKKASVIPNIVYPPSVDGDAGIPVPDGKFIVSLGRLGVEKGHDILIEAFAKIAPLYPDVTLLLIGEGAQRNALENLASALNIKDRVFMPGATGNPFPAIIKAKAFVLPSRFEGFPNALTEAMALGLSCIATRFAGVEDIIRDGENGMLVPLEDPQALAQALALILEQPENARAMGDEARRVSESFSPARVMALWDEALAV